MKEESKYKEYYDKGINEYFKGFYVKAIIYFKKALKEAERVDDKEAILDSYNSIGNVNANIGNREESIKCYTKAIELGGENKKVYYNRGIIKAELNQYEEAIKDFDKVIELDSQFAKFFNLDNKIKGLARLVIRIEGFEENGKLASNNNNSDLNYDILYDIYGIPKKYIEIRVEEIFTIWEEESYNEFVIKYTKEDEERSYNRALRDTETEILDDWNYDIMNLITKDDNYTTEDYTSSSSSYTSSDSDCSSGSSSDGSYTSSDSDCSSNSSSDSSYD